MARQLKLAKTEEEMDEIKQSWYGKVGHQPKHFFPSNRPDKTAWNRLKDKYPLPDKVVYTTWKEENDAKKEREL